MKAPSEYYINKIEMKGISVIIPTYNREKLIGEAIKSVLDQDYNGNVEIVISDDGSTDNTVEVVSSFGSNVTFLHKPVDCLSQGASGARNRGILKASQPYICFLDSDDLYLPGHLKKMVSALEAKSEFSFAICNSLEMVEINNKRVYRLSGQKPILTIGTWKIFL
ncbi:glycosyltransferase family 2 protein [Antarcticibacterium sp. 1MA-6-2]|uniref:glycosyltransferase family 2 protein n=1 Tax=Antarcticibacterium sp. 1MA-6-2 TaxID=2908210 RepID=UPI001F19972A|nr:glycosyltransferase family A protein [Antarcticibacterium sp. 1MA-6-2]UJH91746.1 glycosyltransferase family 2 protein [Antarcticibacterium sp. 1MA-6-2]